MRFRLCARWRRSVQTPTPVHTSWRKIRAYGLPLFPDTWYNNDRIRRVSHRVNLISERLCPTPKAYLWTRASNSAPPELAVSSLQEEVSGGE